MSGLSSKHITTVACGDFSSYAVDRSGTLYSWGNGACGCLGVGGEGNRAVPKPVNLGRHRVKDLAVGSQHCFVASTSMVALRRGAMQLPAHSPLR